MITLEPAREPRDGEDGWGALGLSQAGLSGFLKRAQAAVGLAGTVEVLLAGDGTLRRLNRRFRGKNKATDVLSFPAAEGFAGGHAGDLAISVETAARQAAEHGHTLRDEVRVLLLHGLLHLSGMDHEADGGEMAAMERGLRRALRLPGGLIERVEDPLGAEDHLGVGKQIPFENYRKKDSGSGKRRSPSGTTIQAAGRAKVRTEAKLTGAKRMSSTGVGSGSRGKRGLA